MKAHITYSRPGVQNPFKAKKTPFGVFFAEKGGFEPPVRLPVRQFSKLLV